MKTEIFNTYLSGSMMAFPSQCYGVGNENNIWCKNEEKDFEVCLEQWYELYETLVQFGPVSVLPAPTNKEGLKDLVYTANAGVLLPTPEGNCNFLLSNFQTEPRKPEEKHIKKFVEFLGLEVKECPYPFEGEADLKYIGKKDNQHIFVGQYGIRTSIEALNWIEETYKVKVIKIKNTSPQLYHLDCLFFPLERISEKNKKARALVCWEVIEKKEQTLLEEFVEREPLTSVSEQEAAFGICNCVLKEECIIAPSDLLEIEMYKESEEDEKDFQIESLKVNHLEEIAFEFNKDLIFVDISEFYKDGASLSCLCCNLDTNIYS